MSNREILDFAVEYVCAARHRVSPCQLQKVLSQRYLIGTRRARDMIRRLLAAGELAYSYEYGASYLDISPLQPLRVSEHIVVLPPGIDPHCAKSPPGAIVRIAPGASFGTGRHPSTRLALRGVDAVVAGAGGRISGKETALLDIGTGSGILALAALHLGIGRAVGIDPDPCARAEAWENAAVNGLASRFLVTDQALSQLPDGGRFTIITANLRYPTIKQLAGLIGAHLATGGSLVLAGIKSDEQADLLAVYGRRGFFCHWQAAEKGWVGLVLRQEG
ncbi:MAG: 50S ribosomal protein L11 methyltransferase [Desulfobacterales bacterium]